ncbi:MAG: PASTA domain-containing protein, partial [Candidatus Nanopelagicales bacterium]|nr:PASTA domain-containing protein [Candidatus Nanopelagicales bacterium]
RAANPHIPAEVDALIADATSRDANARLATAASFLARVRAIAATLPPPQPLSNPNDTLVVPTGPPPATDLEPSTQDSWEPPVSGAHRGPGRRWRAGLVITLVAVLATAALAWALAIRPFDRTEVPSITGTTESRATKLLESAGFSVEVMDRVFSETAPTGRVVGSDPAPGQSARIGSTVSLVVSLGPERYAVPDVKKMTVPEAADRLTQSNLVVGGETSAYHDNIAAGLVIRANPKIGAEVKRDTSVSLVLSKGPAPVKIPNLRGMSEVDARATLKRLGLKITATTQISETVPKGDVIKSAPRPGKTVPRGSEVALTVSEGPPPVVVPNVVDMPRAQAVATVQSAGLKVRIEEGIVTPLDRVYSQDPPGGTSIPKGSTVTLSIF